MTPDQERLDGILARGIVFSIAWWCLIVGFIGMLVWFPIFAVGIFNNVR